MHSESSTIDPVTAVRKVKKTPGVNGIVHSSTPAFRDRMDTIPEDGKQPENLSKSHFVNKINEAKQLGPDAALQPLIVKDSSALIAEIKKDSVAGKSKAVRNRSYVGNTAATAVNGAVPASTALVEAKPFRNRSYGGAMAARAPVKSTPPLPEIVHPPNTSVLDAIQEVRNTVQMVETSKSVNSSLSASVSALSVSIPEKLSDVIVPNNSAKPFKNRSYANPTSTSSNNSSGNAKATDSFPLSNSNASNVSNSTASSRSAASSKPYRNRSYAGTTSSSDAQHSKSNSIL